MKHFEWDKEKNEWLKAERDISFEDVVEALQDKKELDRIIHPNKKRYPHQTILVVAIDNYAYLVPYVEDEAKVFLKTVIPSRKMTKKYLTKEK